MFRLYTVTLYNFSDNEYLHVWFTVESNATSGDAENKAKEYYGGDWKVQHSRFMCQTPNEVFIEI